MSGSLDLSAGLTIKEVEEVEVSARDISALLHDFMDEILFRFSTGKVAVDFCEMRICSNSPCKLAVQVGFVDYYKPVHGQGSEVKAVTFSNLQVSLTRPFDAFIVLDI
jgi:SHS2 domain-containing protein